MKQIKKTAILFFLIIGVSISIAYKSDFFEIAKQLEIYTTLFKELNMYYIDEINPAKINQIGINSMLKSLDPYTRFYDEQGVENARINANGQYGGTGLIAKFKNKKLVVTAVYQNSPASKASIYIGDEITAINGIAVDAKQKEANLSQLKGLPDTKISLEIKRQNKSFKRALILTTITKNPVPFFTLLDKKSGYIALTKFNEKTFDKVEDAFLKLKDRGMTQLVLDLRGNPGGLLNQAIDVVSLFVPKGSLVVTTKAKVKKWSNTYRTMKAPLDLTIPIVVLVNSHSASASEIVSGSLQDLDRAVIVGSRSYGKGLVQRYRKLTYGTQFKLTISKYYTPSGRNIQEMDYTNRVGDSIPKFSDQRRPEFKTKNGRIIYGGGGITPDVIVKEMPITKTSKALLKTDAVFDFATRYFYNHKAIDSVVNFSLKQSDFQDFLNFVKKDKIFVSPVQKSIETSSQLSIKAKLNVGKIYQKLKDQINQEQFSQLKKDRVKISEALSSEIIGRYYFEKGKYQYNLQHDNALKEATNVLNDNHKYKSILHQ
ncbi:MAG: S41 family peptidase [Flavobacteriaceae bacterium]|nr:S41 family peptidase [Flavobacteriaceae bacterium]